MTAEVMTAQATGNTKPSLRARAYQITINRCNAYEAIKEYILSLKCNDYFISCREIAPTTGHEHIHVYCHFRETTKISLKKLYDQHIEICRGSPRQNIEYIKKDGNIIDEIGEPPHQGKLSIKEMIDIDDVTELPDWHMCNTWQKLKSITANDIEIDELAKDVKVYYISGPSGCGKTEMAKQIVRDNKDQYGTKINMVKYDGNFWLGCGNTKIAIYDDFRSSHMKASEFINFIDYNRHVMNIKGGSMMNNYNLIIITSVEDLNDIYKNMIGEPRQQWIRRVEHIKMKSESDNDIDVDQWC